MNKHKKNKTSGITIISLVVTVIVLLILAGISITMLSGDNGILLNVANAKERTEIKREEEIVEQSVLEAINKDKFGDLTLSKLSNYLGINSKDGATVELVDGEFLITFKDTERIFKANKDGKVEYLGTSSVLKNTATITASPEKNEYPMLAQSTEITISTIIKKQDDEVIVHYGWSKDKKTEPTNYTSLSDYTTITERKRIGTATIEDAEGSYYLWVQVLLDNNVITQKFGPYNIKSNTSLVSTSGEGKPTSGFLGSDKFENSKVVTRSTINSVKISDTFTDQNGVTHTINDSNCWDASKEQDKRSILAWYEVAYDSEGNEVKNADENTMYNITIAQEGGVTAAVNSSYLFYNVGQGGTGIDVITGLEHLDTQFTTNMRGMFANSTVKELDLTPLDTRNVTYMGNLFDGCRKLIKIDLTHFNTSKVTHMFNMFCNCNVLEKIDVSKFDTSNTISMDSMFSHCYVVKELDVSNFDTSNVTSMYCIFQNCKDLTSLDTSNFNTSKVTRMDHAFDGCSGLKELNVSSFNTSSVTKMNSMFLGCSGLTKLDVSNFDTSNVNYMQYMFNNCRELISLDVSGFATSNVISMGAMFTNCSRLTNLDVSNFNTSNVTDMSSMFSGCNGLTNLDVTNFNTEKVIYMSSMFSGCSGLTNVNVSNFNTSKVTSMRSMFSSSGIEYIDLSNRSAESLKDVTWMCSYCTNLKNIDFTNFKTGKLSGLREMFYRCENLKSLNLNGFDTSEATTMSNAFTGCKSLESLNVSSFKTENVTNMYAMFTGCSSLTNLDLTSFNTAKVTSWWAIFMNDSNLLEILVSKEWNLENKDGSMFKGCGVSNVTVVE